MPRSHNNRRPRKKRPYSANRRRKSGKKKHGGRRTSYQPAQKKQKKIKQKKKVQLPTSQPSPQPKKINRLPKKTTRAQKITAVILIIIGVLLLPTMIFSIIGVILIVTGILVYQSARKHTCPRCGGKMSIESELVHIGQTVPKKVNLQTGVISSETDHTYQNTRRCGYCGYKDYYHKTVKR